VPTLPVVGPYRFFIFMGDCAGRRHLHVKGGGGDGEGDRTRPEHRRPGARLSVRVDFPYGELIDQGAARPTARWAGQ